MKTLIVFLAPGFEEIEALSVVDYLRRAGVNVITAAVAAKDTSVAKIVCGAHKIQVVADVIFREYVASLPEILPDAIYLPGGLPGATNLAACPFVVDFVKKCFEDGKLVSAICASPAVVLAKTGILAGKKFTCYPGMQDEIPDYCGESYPEIVKDSVYLEEPFVHDGNLITGNGPGSAEMFSLELVKTLCGGGVAEKVKRGAIMR